MQSYQADLEALRSEIERSKANYHLELANETNRRLGQIKGPGMKVRRVVDARQRTLQELERRYDELRQDMQDDIAHLRSQQRSAALAMHVVHEHESKRGKRAGTSEAASHSRGGPPSRV